MTNSVPMVTFKNNFNSVDLVQKKCLKMTFLHFKSSQVSKVGSSKLLRKYKL